MYYKNTKSIHFLSYLSKECRHFPSRTNTGWFVSFPPDRENVTHFRTKNISHCYTRQSMNEIHFEIQLNEFEIRKYLQ